MKKDVFKSPIKSTVLILSFAEKKIITAAIHEYFKSKAKIERQEQRAAFGESKILMCTAYSTNYAIGNFCNKINEAYALKFGYEFVSIRKPLEQMIAQIYPKQHCTWYKIYLLLQLFQDLQSQQTQSIHYVMWIDADAFVVNHSINLHTIIQHSGERELIIAEDTHPGCLVNAGVFLLRVNEWSYKLLNDIWHCNRFDDVCFYEQSALIKCLKGRGEGLEHVQPFHSYLRKGETDSLRFAHVAVLPHKELNTSSIVEENDIRDFMNMIHSGESDSSNGSIDTTSSFIFHAAGCKNKLNVIATAIWKFRPPPYDSSSKQLLSEFMSMQKLKTEENKKNYDFLDNKVK